MFKSIFSLIQALQSNVSPGEIAAGAVMGLFFGMTPLNHTHVIFLILAFFLFKINRGITVLALPLYKLMYYMGLVALADRLGHWLLVDLNALTPFWTWVTHAPVLVYLDLNYTLVLGGIVLSLFLSVPVYILVVHAVNAYRARFRERVHNWRIVKWFQGLSFVRLLSSWWPHE